MNTQQKERFFFQVLTFQRYDKENPEKTAKFVDKFGAESYVQTSFGGIVPGLRYSCKLLAKPEFVEDKITGSKIYKMLSYRLWLDDLMVVTEEDKITVLLDNKEVENLTFGFGYSLDVEEKVDDLKEYFKKKVWQLEKPDIESFVEVYKRACEKIERRFSDRTIKKKLMKSA